MENMKRLRSSRFAAVAAAVFWAIILRPAAAQQTATKPSPWGRQAVTVRGDLDHSRSIFAESKRGTVVFMGGSITEMKGYRPMVCQSLQTRFPDTEFTFINAGISSTCSHTGAFRMPTDILTHHPDLLLVEFAVNDDQDADHSYQQALRGMEGILRSARNANPNLDIIVTHFVNPPMLETVRQGGVPTSIRAHETAADHYSVSTCNVAVELADQIATGKTTWEIYGGVHPKPAGNRIATDLIERVFDRVNFSAEKYSRQQPELPPRRKRIPHPLPPPIDDHCFANGRFLDDRDIRLGARWQRLVPDWKAIPGSFRSRFADRKLTVAESPGAELKIDFRGTAVGLFVLAGPDAGSVDYAIDNGPWQTKDLYHRFSKGLHYPRTVVLQSGLKENEHSVRLRVSESKNDSSSGHAVRVLEFVAN